MKRFFTILSAIILLSGLQAQAAPVTSDRALEIAKLIFGAQPATKAAYGAIKVVWDGEPVATKAAVQPAFYVIAREGGGFVIIAGDDNVRPVLAISENGRFSTEGMPDNVKWWMERMKKYVRSASSQSAEVRDLWNKYTATKAAATISGEVTGKVEHLTPEWDQGNNDNYSWTFGRNVFNAKCPLQNGQLTITGCVATALAEVLTTISGLPGVTMPASASGTVGGYETSGGFVAPAAYELGTVYNWAGLRSLTNFQAIRDNLSNTALLDNLGQLMADCGALVQAWYSTGATSAATSNAPYAFAEHFSFNKGAYYASEGSYTQRKWIEMLKEQLDSRPIVYDGQDVGGQGGHAFVFDGYGQYEGTDVFHVNFGWGGGCNGYYYHTNLDSGDNGNYSASCGALFDFYPDVEGTSTYRKEISLVSFLYNGELHCGLVRDRPIRQGEQFLLSFGAVSNRGSMAYTGTLKLVLEDKYGTLKQNLLLLDVDGMSVGGLYWWNYWATINCAPAFGDRIKMYYSTNDSGEAVYEPVTFSADGSVIGELPLMPAAVIDIGNGGYQVGDYFQFHLLNCDYIYPGTIWKITTPSGTVVTRPQSQVEFQLTEPGPYKIVAETRSAEGSAIIETLVAKIRVSGE